VYVLRDMYDIREICIICDVNVTRDVYVISDMYGIREICTLFVMCIYS